MDHQILVEIFKALGDKNRVSIIELLKTGDMRASDLLSHLEISQPTLSYHMHSLCEARIVIPHKEGKFMRYSLNEEARLAIEKFITMERGDA